MKEECPSTNKRTCLFQVKGATVIKICFLEHCLWEEDY